MVKIGVHASEFYVYAVPAYIKGFVVQRLVDVSYELGI